MAEKPKALLSVAELFAEREAHERQEREAEERLKQKEKEKNEEYRKRLDTFEFTEQIKADILFRIKQAFSRGESELMLISFPSGFCSDSGRAIANVNEPPINRPSPEENARSEPDWLTTLPHGAIPLYQFWSESLKPGGFRLEARIINYPGGKLGDVGLFFTWPRTGDGIAA